ncbi:MAG: FKBP-type peptidyl-prolyl cis-trans isomerase [Proteobacteria bacterium]|jgi:FKBP-type peptidyl-prolyl cis-trans isomerase SlpA|nr:FKBP-type peptidyl-prolyl cis-trans isomerase [Pseudomonadota bacterium]
MDNVPIGPGTRVTLTFTLALSAGDVIDSTGDQPATFEVGDGSLLPGFESAMYGMKAGDSAALPIAADRGFGLPNEENVHMLKRALFEVSEDLVEGLVVSFADGEGGERPGVVKRLFDEVIEIDFNHPLAGQDLLFSVQIKQVEQISDEILRM